MGQQQCKGNLVEEGLLKNKIGFQKTSIGTCLICFVFESKTELEKHMKKAQKSQKHDE